MKRSIQKLQLMLRTATLALGAALVWTVPGMLVSAHAVEMPKDLIGSWCLESPGTYVPGTYVRCKKGDLVITRKTTVLKQHICKVLSVSEQGERTWITKEHCHEISTVRYVRRATFLDVTPLEPE